MPVLAATAALPATVDVLVVGSGMGGASFAAGIAGRGPKLLILERGEQLAAEPRARDTRAIFVDGSYRPAEMWYDHTGAAFNPGNYYYVGGNSKFYGAVLMRYRAEDFEAMQHAEGVSPAWPFPYGELEPWYSAAERLLRVRGQLGEDPTEPPHSQPYAFGPVPDEPAIARVRERLKVAGLSPASLPLSVDIDRWLAGGATPWDAYPDTRSGKEDAETGPLAAALGSPDVTLATGARVLRLIAGSGGRIDGVEVERGGTRQVIRAGTVVVAAGAVKSAALLLASGVANRSDQVGRNFMNHNLTALLAIDPRTANDSVYQKTLSINDFYLDDGDGGGPLGNVQLLGRVTAPILKANLRFVPEWPLALLSRRSVDWLIMSEDLPDPASRISLDGERIVLQWRRSNMLGHRRLIARMRERFRAAGYPLALTHLFDRRTPSHQCGTVRIGIDGADAPLDPQCRAHDHPNLLVVDAGALPTSAAVNPALTVAALALRAADHLASSGFSR